MRFVDTNIFIYYLFPNADLNKHEACAQLFEKALRQEVKLWTSEWVIAELVWFLYRQNKSWSEIKSYVVDGIIKGGQVKVDKEAVVIEILESSKNDSDFIDYMNRYTLSVKNIKEGYSYDNGLDSWKNFKRLEP